jgi:glycosyltransferase involved in cell wall biosynthesis
MKRLIRTVGRRLRSKRSSEPSGNGRLAFVGPLPPAATGVASYDRAVLDGLERTGSLGRYPTDVLWPVGRRHRRSIRDYELGIFQIGNNLDFHREIYRLACSHPGLVVLHDLAIDGFARGIEMLGDPLARRTLREAAALPYRPTDPDVAVHEPLRVVWCAAVARASRGIIVHSDFCKRYLASTGCRTPVYVVPHPPVETPEAIARAQEGATELRGRLAAEGASILLVAPGDINETKQPAAILAALARLPKDVHLAFVGRPVGYDVERAIDRYGVRGRAIVRPGVSDEEFLSWIVAADLVVDLRFPHRGEVSGSLARAMQAARPTIVSATGTYLDVPRDAVVGISAGPADPDELRSVIERLIDEPDRRIRIGAAAGAYMDRLARSEATAHGYEHAIGATMELMHDHEHVVLERWARTLVSLGMDQTMLEHRFGLPYARALVSLRPGRPGDDVG